MEVGFSKPSYESLSASADVLHKLPDDDATLDHTTLGVWNDSGKVRP